MTPKHPDPRVPVRKKDLYPGVAAEAARRRLTQAQIITADELGTPEYRMLTPDEVAEVNVDESYQRRRVDSMVEEISEVIKRDGIVPDPVSIAIREDGSMWVVDGQQRWWAHLAACAAMPAMLYKVTSMDAERRLFDILNHRTNLTGATIIKAWGGPAKDLLTWLDTDPSSGLRGRIGWAGTRSPSTLRVEVVMRALQTLCLNVTHSGPVRDCLLRLDTEVKRRKLWTYTAAGKLSHLLAEVFPAGRSEGFRTVIAHAFGRTCFLRWQGLYERDNARWPYPSPQGIATLKTTDWYLLVPHGGPVGAQAALNIIERAWPVAGPQKARAS